MSFNIINVYDPLWMKKWNSSLSTWTTSSDKFVFSTSRDFVFEFTRPIVLVEQFLKSNFVQHTPKCVRTDLLDWSKLQKFFYWRYHTMDAKLGNCQTKIKVDLKVKTFHLCGKLCAQHHNTFLFYEVFIWIPKILPEDKQKLDMMLPLRMDRMHVKALYGTWKISCPREEYGDEVDWQASNPNLCLQT